MKGTRQRKEEEKDERGGKRSWIQQERKHINIPNTSALNTSKKSSPHDMLSFCNDTPNTTPLNVTPIVLPLNASVTHQSNHRIVM